MNVYDTITDRIVKQLESGAHPGASPGLRSFPSICFLRNTIEGLTS